MLLILHPEIAVVILPNTNWCSGTPGTIVVRTASWYSWY